jgi:hypothetical protein
MWATSSIQLDCGCKIEYGVPVEKVLDTITWPGDTMKCPNTHGDQIVVRVSGAKYG